MSFRISHRIAGVNRGAVLVLALAVPMVAVTVEGAGEGSLQFNRDIRPILSDKCYHCHGPDAGTREAGLRLDTREGAIEGKAIVPKEPGKSELLARVKNHAADEVMPPPESKLGTLSEAQVATLERWIKEGAEYQKHWSFEPVAMEAGKGNLDERVERKLKEKGLSFQPEAERTTLIRRVSFDLTGLPPTVAEVEAFVADKALEAYERLVDRLLASPQYGERMAVDWLDVSRYADSYGFQVDRAREVWPWRDWVVKAFNENLPFDEFITWQVAGDLLPEATEAQVLATAFNRLHQQESEGGSVEEEYRREYVSDRLHTFGTAFLGLTLECARCHDHKYDPISQKEYYEMAAFFQNIDEAGLYSYFTESVPTPALSLENTGTKEALDAAQVKLAELEKTGTELRESRRAAFGEWRGKWAGEMKLKGELARFEFEEANDGEVKNEIAGGASGKMVGANRLEAGRDGAGKAVHFSGDDPVNLPVGNFSREQPFAISLWVKAPEKVERAVVMHRSRAWTDAASRGYELLIEDGKLKWSLIHFWPGNAISVKAKEALKIGEWVQVMVSYDGSSRAAGLKVFVNGSAADVEVERDGLTREITGGGGDNIALGERFRDRGFKGGMIDDVRVFGRGLGAVEAKWLFDGGRVEDEGALFEHYLRDEDEVWAKHLEKLQKLRRQVALLMEGRREMMVMKELPQPKKAFVLVRGEYAQHGEEVFAGTLKVLPPFPQGAKHDRLALAKWLTDRGHPLTARVTVNRLWQSVFGRGLVKTSEDFGSQGERPLQAEVLDWLAADFMNHGWDVKRLMKTMVMSRTYRQRSFGEKQMMVDDPDNEWLSRGPRFRLSAEMIRDNALAMSGLLNPVMGGAPVNPYEMQEAFKPVANLAKDGLYRRSLYTNWRRTAPPPAMVAFDAPRRAVCSAKRERTDSPLQALILLNGPQFVEAARVIAQEVLWESRGEVEEMAKLMFLRCVSREPDAVELSILRQLHAEQVEYFRAHEADAVALLKMGTEGWDEKLTAAELAAATVLAQTLMNHDECVVKR